MALTLMSIILLIDLLTSTYADDLPYHLNPINSKTGIFFHHIGQAKISHDYFTLLSYTNISIYETKLKLIHNIYQKSMPLCNGKNLSSSQNQFLCRERIELFQNLLNTLNEKFDSLSHLTGHEIQLDDRRSKRGLFDGVSYAFKWLFGTPDAEDAKYYNEAIESMAQQNHDMQILVRQQIHIISDAISDYNKSAQALYLNEQKLNDNIIKFNKFSEGTVTKINSLTYSQTITDHFNLLSHLINELNEEFDVIISSILFSKQNVLHPSVITPRHLLNELSKIKINANFEFPINNNNIENAYKYFEICELSVIYVNKILIYAIKIPLVTNELYQLYNLVSLPIQSLNTTIYSYISPTFPYLLLSTTRTFYGHLKDLSVCKKSPPSDYICSHVTTHLIKERPTCETDLKLRQPNSIPKSCSTKTIKSEIEIWHPLSQNQWLYILTQPVAGTVSCDDSTPVLDFVLHGTGIFTLKAKCKCYTLSTLLVATSNMSANYSNFIPSVNIINDDCCIQEQKFLQVEKMDTIKLNNLNLNELRHAQHKLKQFDDQLQQSINQPFIVHHSKWYNVLLGILATIIFVILFCCGCCRCCHWRRFPWLRRFFNSSQCQYMVCINSHNTISHSDVHSMDWEPHQNLRRITSNEALSSLQMDVVSLHETDQQATDLKRSKLKGKKTFKI